MNQLYKNIALWIIIIATVLLMYTFLNQKAPEDKKIIFSDFIAAVESGNVDEVMIQGQNIKGVYKGDKKKFVTYAPNDPELVGNLREKALRYRPNRPWTRRVGARYSSHGSPCFS